MFLAEYFLGNFYWHLAAFYWSHCILASDAPGRRNWELIFNFFQRFLLKLIQIRRWRRRRRQWWRRRLHRGRRVLKRRTPFCEKNGERKIEGSTGGLVCGLGGVQLHGTDEKPDSIRTPPGRFFANFVDSFGGVFAEKKNRFGRSAVNTSALLFSIFIASR